VCHADSEGLNFRKALKEAGWDLKQNLIWVKNSLVLGRQDYQWQHEPILYGWKPGAAHKWYGARNKTTVWDNIPSMHIEEIDSDTTQITIKPDMANTLVIKVPTHAVELEHVKDSETDIWYCEKPKKNGEHPTMKPLKLISKALQNSSKRGDLVLDPFGGSGSTLMACDEMERLGRTIEFDPKYADVIVNRYRSKHGEGEIFVERNGRRIHITDLGE
jgi:DNA modification methylase